MGEAIDSRLGRLHTEFEWLRVDDGSIDNRPALIGSQRDVPLPLIGTPESRPVAAPCNRCIEAARSEFPACPHSEDCAQPQRRAMALGALARWLHRALHATLWAVLSAATQPRLRAGT
ncbi:glycosyltransferase [Salinisphaera sp. T31B1]|uniref:glycosyltransferase n=1 Tax=Salinisphaera sp. T31B1 TaxID=727963 RepID=UPI00333EBA86